MELSGPHFEQLQDALLDAYTEFGLRQMLRVQMDVDLDRVAGGGDLSEITFTLIRWAEQRGQVPRLIEAAYAGNQENPQLAALAIDAQSWFADRDESSPPLDELAPAPPQTAHQIFLSYSRKDSRQMQTVHRALTDAGLSVWTDEGLAVGTHHWETAIETAIERAECMVVLMSPDAKQSKWVNAEISYAQEIALGIFPVLLRGNRRASIPLALRTVQFEDGRTDLGAATQRLVTALRDPAARWQYTPTRFAQVTAATKSSQSIDTATPQRWLRILLLALLGLLMLALFLWWLRGDLGQLLPVSRDEPTEQLVTAINASATATQTSMAPVIDPQSVPATDMDGLFTIAGQASPGDEVEILVDGVAVGLATANNAGQWTHRLIIDGPGQHLIGVSAIIGELRRPMGSEPLAIMVAPIVTPINTLTHTPISPAPRLTDTPIPSSRGGNIVDMLVTSGNYKSLVASLEAADLLSTLSASGSLTLFAPTDAAFAELEEMAPGVLPHLMADPTGQLTQILLYHVAAGEYTSADITGKYMPLTSLQGQQITVEVVGNTMKVNDATVSSPDNLAINGVIHGIDNVLLPPLE